jgi:DNA-binding SARP family transcriptional activator/TolB-like protein
METRGFPSLPGHASVELRLLGTVSARLEAGREAAALLAQPKRVALLGYLAAATPAGFHRRDTLLALFWPEADQEHARASLRKSVHFLRQQLGSQVIVSRGDEEIGLDLDRCWCDVMVFDDSIEAEEWQAAAELYQGDLLPGLHLSEVPEFERWLDETRTQLRGAAVRAASQLSKRHDAQGRSSDAIRWARRAIELSPYDEDAIRRLLALLIKAGDRAGAIQVYELFAQRLEADLELEPSADTVTLIESVHRAVPSDESPSRAGQRLSQPVPAKEPSEDPYMGAPANLDQPSRRRSRVVPITLVALSIAAGLGTLVWRFRPPLEPPHSPGTFAVLPFEYRGSPELSYLAEGMVDLLSTKLDGAPGLRTIDQHALLNFVSRERDAGDVDRGRRAAEHFGADRFVLGSIVEAGGQLAVSAAVYDTKGGAQGSIDASAKSAAEIFDVADRLAGHILSEAQDKPLELARSADQATSSLPALKAYIEGERESRNDRPAQALEAFQRAVQLDSAFALAHYRLAFFSRFVPPLKHLYQARHFSGRLSEHQRGLIEALIAYFQGNHAQADSLYRWVLAAHPDDVEAWSMLGYLIGERGYLSGYAWVDAREAYEHVLRLDPQNAGALWWLAAYAARDRRVADLDSLSERFLQPHPEPVDAGNVEAERAIARGDSAGLQRFITDLRGRPDVSAQFGAGVVTWITGDLAAGLRLWRLIAEPSRPSGMRVLAHTTLAKLELTSGQWRAASAELDSAARLDPATTLEHRAYYALTYFLTLSRGELVALRDLLERWNPAGASRKPNGPAVVHRSMRRYLKLYLLGMLNARLGHEAVARRYASELDHADSSTVAGAFAIDQGKVVRAEISWRAGRAEEALATLEQAGFWTHFPVELSSDLPFYIHLHERFARAELLYQLGRMDEAVRWYRSLTYDLLYNAPSHYRLAQIYLARGDKRAAIEHYKQFLKTWRDCDPMLRPQLQQAEFELARLH